MMDLYLPTIVIISIFSIVMIFQGLFTLFWMLFAWDDPDEIDINKSPKKFYEPKFSFCAIIPARNEENVIQDTLRAVSEIDYPESLKETVVVCREDDERTIKKVKDAQESELIDDGFFGGKDVNSPMAIFLLKANHKYVETNRNELVGKDGQPLTISVKIDVAGGYLPPMGRVIATSAADTSKSTSIQNLGVAQESEKNDNSISRNH